MDIALGVSMTPTTVRMVLVEGENADGVTVDHDVFDITSDHTSATAPEQVVAAILGTRESADRGRSSPRFDRCDVARPRRRRRACGRPWPRTTSTTSCSSRNCTPRAALAQAAGGAVGYQRTALMFLDGDTATLSVVETADGSIVRVAAPGSAHRERRRPTDVDGRRTGAISPAPPQGVFVVGSGVSVAASKLQLESATSLPVSAPDEPELALARGAALASVRAPLFEASTVARAYAQDGDEGPTAASDHAVGYAAAPAALAYSEVEPDDEPDFAVVPGAGDAAVARQERKPFLLVGSAVTGIFVLGVAALVISLAVSIRPTVDQRPSPAESVIVPTHAPAPAAAVPAAPPPPAAPWRPFRRRSPSFRRLRSRSRRLRPARSSSNNRPRRRPLPPHRPPAPAPAAPPPAPVAPPVVAPVVPAPVVVPRLPIIRWPWERQNQYPQNPPQQQWPPQQQNPWYPPQQQNPPQWDPPQSDDPPWKPPKQDKPPAWDPPGKDDSPSWNPPKQQWPESGSGRGSGSRDDGGGSGSGSGGNRGSNGGGNTLWPWPNWGN